MKVRQGNKPSLQQPPSQYPKTQACSKQPLLSKERRREVPLPKLPRNKDLTPTLPIDKDGEVRKSDAILNPRSQFKPKPFLVQDLIYDHKLFQNQS